MSDRDIIFYLVTKQPPTTTSREKACEEAKALAGKDKCTVFVYKFESKLQWLEKVEHWNVYK